MKKFFTLLVLLTGTCLLLNAENEPNDWALNANTLVINGSDNGTMTAIDNVDWWKIVITTDGRLRINTTSQSALCVGAYLYDQDSTTQLTNNYWLPGIYCNDTSKTMEYSLTPGTYYIKCQNEGGTGSYSITSVLILPTLPTDPEPNNFALQAATIAPNSTATGHLGYHGNGTIDNTDWWKITLTANARLRINTTSQSELCVGAYIYDQDSVTELTNNYWLPGIYCSDTSKTMEYSLLPGTYYIKCFDWDGYSSYSITASLITPLMPNDIEPNDTVTEAIVLPLNDSLTGQIGYYGNGFTDTEDWYKVTTVSNGRLVINTKTEQSLCIGAYLYAPDTTTELTNNYWLNGLYCFDTSKTMYSALLLPGTYFIKCRKEEDYGSYRLKALFEPVPEAQFSFTGSINTFSFSNSSLYASTYLWDFGDGTTSTLVNPQHTYQESGVYNVCIFATNAVGADTFCLYVSVKGIKNVVVNKAGNTGDATIYVYGGGFTTNTTFKLTRSGYPDITGDTTIIPCIGAIRSTFDLRNQPVGLWNVVVNIPGDTIMTLVNGFTIEQGVAADPWVDIIGRDRLVFNRNQTYTIAYGNNGNVDATGVPLWIVVQNDPGITVTFEGFEVELPKVAIDSGWTVIKDSIPLYQDVDSLFGEPFIARIYGFYIPIIPAGQTESVKMIIKSDQDVKVMAWVNPPYFQSPLSTDFKTCIALAAAKMLTNGIGLVSPIGSCIHSVTTTYVYDWWSYKQPQPQTPKTWGSSLWNLTTTALSCAGALTPMGMALNWAVNVTAFAADFSSSWDAAMACKEAYGQKSRKDKSIRAVSSLDPNEIIGPSGYASANYSLKNSAYAYSIYFENLATATSPAQEVVVTDTLDLGVYDINNFSFGNITFGDTVIVPVPDQKEFTMDIDMRPAKNIIVRTDAKLDTLSGVITWHFLSLDPATMNLTEDPMEGFLPPNVTSPQGEGSVSFSAGLKTSLIHGSQIKNKAVIVFDLNQPIATNQWLNTIDTIVPQSSVTPLNNIIYDTVFQVQWAGSDIGCGTRNYTVFVSENDSDYVAWKSYTPATSATFTGHFGSSYKFYSVAFDSLGLTEETPTMPDASTQLQLSINDNAQNPFAMNIYPNPANRSAQMVFTLPQKGDIKVEITDVQGKTIKVLMHKLMNTGTHLVNINTEDIDAGIYLIKMTTQMGSAIKKLIIIK